MKIVITDNRKIQQLQEQFSAAFPFLKLEFFSKPHKPGAGTAARLRKPVDKTIGECRRKTNRGHLNIDPDMTVAELEQRFRDTYGLNVQVFRKSGKVWLETTVTDGWTLDEQNRQGEMLSSLVLRPSDNNRYHTGD